VTIDANKEPSRVYSMHWYSSLLFVVEEEI
jgi:hypothetical protein